MTFLVPRALFFLCGEILFSDYFFQLISFSYVISLGYGLFSLGYRWGCVISLGYVFSFAFPFLWCSSQYPGLYHTLFLSLSLWGKGFQYPWNSRVEIFVLCLYVFVHQYYIKCFSLYKKYFLHIWFAWFTYWGET